MKHARMVLILIATLAGAGCTKTVLVPVSSCPAPPPFEVPSLMVDSLTTTATTQDKLQALKIDYGTMKKTIEQCKVLLDAYRKPAKK